MRYDHHPRVRCTRHGAGPFADKVSTTSEGAVDKLSTNAEG